MPNVSQAVPSSARATAQGPAVDRLAQVGLVAYGIVHLLIGWLAIQLAFGGSEESADNQGALQALADTPLGKPVLWLLAAGFAALVVWRIAEAFTGYRDEDDGKRAVKRAASLGQAVVYAVIGFSAAKIAAGSGGSSSDSSGENVTSGLLGLPGGPVLVALLGLAIAGVGGALIWKGISGSFREQLDAEGQSGTTGTVLVRLGTVGYVAKGSAFVVLGGLFVLAAFTEDPERSGGLDDALKTLLDQPAGVVLVPLIGLGIAAYGLYCFARARHLRRA